MAKTDRRAIYKVCISQKALPTNISQQCPKQICTTHHQIGVPSPFLTTETGMVPVTSGTHTKCVTGPTVHSNTCVSFAEAPSQSQMYQTTKYNARPPSSQNTRTSTVFPAQLKVKSLLGSCPVMIPSCISPCFQVFEKGSN